MDERELKGTSYELLTAGLSVLSIVNLVIELTAPSELVAGVIHVIDVILTGVFLLDFIYRITTAESPRNYFLHQFGWADLLSSLPFPRAKILRVFRLVRVYRLMSVQGPRWVMEELVSNRAGSALYSVLLLLVLVLEFGSVMIVRAEGGAPGADITTAGDALWWTFVTITTVGYGDYAPVTPHGRVVGVLVMTAGVGLFGVLTGFLANAFLAPRKNRAPEEGGAEGPDTIASEIKRLRGVVEEQGVLHASLVERLDALDAVLTASGAVPESPE